MSSSDETDPTEERLRRALDHSTELERQNQELREVLGLLTVEHSLTRKRKDYFEGLAEKALVNPKTGLPNEEAMKVAFEKLKHKCSTTTSSAMYFDLNGFKNVNDTYGHAAGDEFLKAVGVRLNVVGGRLAKRLRSDDYLGHLHGDEFLVLLPFTPAEDAIGVAHELNDIIRGTTIEVEGFDTDVSASFGVCAIDPKLGFEEIRDRADRAMYIAKHGDGEDVAVI